VADILKATGSLLGEVGYDGLSTNLVAERAKVPPISTATGRPNASGCSKN
jgi:DNA-binding transcriptional regulator YbjK